MRRRPDALKHSQKTGLAIAVFLLLSFIAASPSENSSQRVIEIAAPSSEGWGKLRDSYGAETFEDLLRMPRDRIDIATASLLLSKLFDSEVDVAAGVAQVDRIAGAVRQSLPDRATPEQAIEIINDCLFDRYHSKQNGFIINPAEGLLSTVLDTGEGNCLGLSTLYIAVCRRLGLPVAMVRMPRHIFVRYSDGETCINIEATYRGRSRSNCAYAPELSPEELADRLHDLDQTEELSVLVSNLASAFSKRGEVHRAADVCRESLGLGVNSGVVHNSLGSALFFAKSYGEAERSFTSAIERDPFHAAAFANRGLSRAMQGRYEAAAADFDRAIELNPDDAKAFNNRGSLRLAMNQLEAALADFDRAIEIDPQYAAAFANRGDTFACLRDYGKALDDYNAAERLRAACAVPEGAGAASSTPSLAHSAPSP